MKARTIIIFLFLGLILTHSFDAKAFLAHGPIQLSVGIIVNTIGGDTIQKCVEEQTVQIYDRAGQVHVSLGVADEQSIQLAEWQEIFPSVFCSKNAETRDNSISDQQGAPFLLSNVQAKWRVDRQMEDERVLTLQVSITLERSDGSIEGEAAIQSHEVKRTLFFSGDSVAYIPVMLANGEQLRALGLREIFVSLKTNVLKEEQDSIYGTVLVQSGTDSAEVLLDGGVVGKTHPDGELEIGLVKVGVREVGIRESAGKVLRKVVRVKAGRTALVNFDDLQNRGNAERYALKALGENDHGYEEFLRKNDGAVVVKIPQGEFLMGNKNTERTPLEHQVYVSEFLMDKTGVSWSQYKQFAAETGLSLPPHRPYWGILDDHPVVYVTWDEAKAYCEWTGARLPTEAEREKAARGTDGRKFPWGNEPPNDRLGVFRQSWGYDSTGPVNGQVGGASPYGLLNMGGNVWEWCADWYDIDYYQISPFRDPKGPSSGRAHVVRGGSWDSRPDVLSASCRSWGHLGYRDGDFGFRCAMDSPR